MKAKSLIVFALCAAICAGAASCDTDRSNSNNKGTSVTAQEQLKTESNDKSDYVPITVDGMTVIKTGWIKIPEFKEYLPLQNSPDSSQLNGYTYNGMEAEVYKEEGEWLLIKSHDKVGYIQKTYFSETDPESEDTSENISENTSDTTEETSSYETETTSSSSSEDTTASTETVSE